MLDSKEDQPASDADRYRELLESAERIAGLGSWEWVPDRDELLWSDNLFRIFGLEPAAVVPTPEYVLERTHPDDRERMARVVERIRGGRRAPRFEYRMIDPDRGTRHLRAEVVAVEDVPGPRRIIGCVQDITEERRTQRRVAIHVAATTALAEWESFEESAEDLLASLAMAMELDVAMLWFPQGDVLVCRACWRARSVDVSGFVSVTRGLRYPRGVGLPGMAWGRHGPIGLTDPARETSRQRRQVAAAAGLRLRNVYEKLGVSDRGAAVAEAMRLGFIS